MKFVIISSPYSKEHILKFILSILFICLCFTSCHKDTYKYEVGLREFSLKELKLDISNLENSYLFFIDVSCEGCSESKSNFLNAFKCPVQVILLGDTTQNSTARSINADDIFAVDIGRKYLEYETGIAKPILFEIKKGQIIKSLEVDDFNQQEVLSFCQIND